MKTYLKKINRENIDNSEDQLTKVEVKYFDNFTKDGPSYYPEYKIIKVSNFFADNVKEKSELKEKLELERIKELDDFLIMRNKVYASRTFPQKLKIMIFERDDYTCQMCGKHKDLLIKEGAHLEADHIVEVVDGGLTTYDNGQTLCISRLE